MKERNERIGTPCRPYDGPLELDVERYVENERLWYRREWFRYIEEGSGWEHEFFSQSDIINNV